MPVQCWPRSLVRTIDEQGGDAHGAVPSTQPLVSETKVADWAWKPAGTGPPGGRGTAVVVVAVAVTVGDEGGAAVEEVELVAGWPAPPEARWWPPQPSKVVVTSMITTTLRVPHLLRVAVLLVTITV
jgi:hypothetical protein